MNNLFECKVKYLTIKEDGKEKVVSENYLLNAVSFTDAETRIYTEMKNIVSGEFSIASIKRVNYSELILGTGGEGLYKSRVSLIVLDELRGIEKRTTLSVLVAADNVHDADKYIKKEFSDSVFDFSIDSISDSKLTDVWLVSEIGDDPDVNSDLVDEDL